MPIDIDEDDDDEENEDEDLSYDVADTQLSGGDATHKSVGHQTGQIDFSGTNFQQVENNTGSLKPPPDMKRLSQDTTIGQVLPCNRQEEEESL